MAFNEGSFIEAMALLLEGVSNLPMELEARKRIEKKVEEIRSLSSSCVVTHKGIITTRCKFCSHDNILDSYTLGDGLSFVCENCGKENKDKNK